MFRWFIPAVLLPFFALSVSAQAIKLSIKDGDRVPLPGATIQLYRLQDSATAYFGVTDAEGQFMAAKVIPGRYQLTVSFIGYRTAEKTVEAGPKGLTMEIVLQDESLDLSEVTVTARRPLLRQEDDKTIIDPTPLANISTNTLEILEKTPGVFVDQEGYIYLSSTSPAQVYINGREQRMSAQDMAGILRSLPPDNIEKIEVLRTPSTRYDASSSGGIVNVVLKKGVRIGRTGSVNMGINQGVYGNRFAGFNYNDSNDKSTYYLRANLSARDQLDELNSARLISAGATLDQKARTRLPGTQDFLGFGISYDPSEKWNLSYDSRINRGSSESFSSNINRIVSAEQLPVSENDNRIENNAHKVLGAR
jgi:iron complex outermembrane receptor protein